MIQDAFVENGLEEVAVLRQQRDDRYSEWVEQGWSAIARIFTPLTADGYLW